MSSSNPRVLNPRVVVVGGGNMGTALVGGLVASGWEPASIVVVEVDAHKREVLSREWGVATSESLVTADGAVIAVKPGDALETCSRLAAVGVPRVLSIAAGISVSALEAAAARPLAASDAPTGSVKVLRAMPNTPALVREGATALCAGADCDEADWQWAESVLSAVGLVVRVPESQMDAVTAVAGSGPAYVFLLAESLLAAALEEGLPPDVAGSLVRQLFRGAGILLAASNESPGTLRERVTSPNGTTAAGLAVFEERGLREVVHDVVRAAAARSREMGRAADGHS